ncbi:MAG: hypothetical protein QM532_02255 [Cyanobium sp. MAG06]|nr:hypothetical protein [Cyanobium sp. MAG06]
MSNNTKENEKDNTELNDNTQKDQYEDIQNESIDEDYVMEEIDDDGSVNYKSMVKKLKDKIKLLEKEKQDNLNG